MLEAALVGGDTWDQVETRLNERTAQMWAFGDAAMVTEIWGDCLHVWLGAGRLKDLLKLRPQIERVAREWGLKRATINGRIGWSRVLRRYGYRSNGDELEKVL